MHHFISIVLIAICCIIIDLLFGSYSYINNEFNNKFHNNISYFTISAFK